MTVEGHWTTLREYCRVLDSRSSALSSPWTPRTGTQRSGRSSSSRGLISSRLRPGNIQGKNLPIAYVISWFFTLFELKFFYYVNWELDLTRIINIFRRQAKWMKRRFLLESRDAPPVYRVNSSDPEHWQQNCFDPAVSILSAYLEGSTPEAQPLARISVPKEEHDENRRNGVLTSF